MGHYQAGEVDDERINRIRCVGAGKRVGQEALRARDKKLCCCVSIQGRHPSEAAIAGSFEGCRPRATVCGGVLFILRSRRWRSCINKMAAVKQEEEREEVVAYGQKASSRSREIVMHAG